MRHVVRLAAFVALLPVCTVALVAVCTCFAGFVLASLFGARMPS